MPIYLFKCSDCTLPTELYLRFEDYDDPQVCLCGGGLVRQICAPMMVSVSPNICYDSPIDGRPITSVSARTEDLARNNCQPYDPEMKTDYANRLKREDAELDRSVDEVVDREIATMPAVKRERLVNEIASGVNADIVRRAPNE